MLNARGYDTLLSVVRVLAWRADWRTQLTRPTRAGVAAACGCSERTVTRWWKWLEDRRLLTVTEPGTLPRHRPGIIARNPDGPLAKEFRLMVPVNVPVRSCVTPSPPLSTTPPARESDRPEKGPKAALTGADPVVTTLQITFRDLRNIRPQALSRLAYPFLAAGWTAADLVYAISCTPDGLVRTHDHQVRHPFGWARARLAAWQDARGTPARPHSEVLRDRAAAHRAELAAGRRQAASRVPLDQVARARHARHARTLLAAASPEAARVIQRTQMYAKPAQPRRSGPGEQ